jgi:group I intron endonuclease
MSSPQCVIYMYKSPSGKRYIGKTTQKDIRHRKHGYANGDCPYFHKAIRKHKWENFSYEILEEFDDDVTDEFMSDRETHWIEMHDSTNRAFGYNLTKGGEGMTGYKHTDAAKANISKTLTGHKHTDATKAKISDAIKGRTHTDATKAKMKGHIVSAATRAKLSKPVLATEKKTGKKREFESACAAARTLSDETGKKFCQGAVSGCANKRRKSHHGWTFSHL